MWHLKERLWEAFNPFNFLIFKAAQWVTFCNVITPYFL
ncbi:MAG: hypothetical protein JWO06_1982 [Bacteroidota bacterium]|nr:hypothetical protein [Bacteroidota bacterium]